MGQDGLFQSRQALPESLQQRKKAVNGGVEERVRQVISPTLPELAACLTQTLAHALEQVTARLFLKRQDVRRAQEQTHLLGLPRGFWFHKHHVKDQELIVLVILDLSPLRNV